MSVGIIFQPVRIPGFPFTPPLPVTYLPLKCSSLRYELECAKKTARHSNNTRTKYIMRQDGRNSTSHKIC